jgi:hypothetical protein
MKIWTVNCGGTEIKVTNSFATARLLVNGKTQDIFWGLFSLCGNVQLHGSIESGGEIREVRVTLGATCFTVNCAIFIDDEMVFCSADA